jgi:hypothetical protein
MIQAIIRNYYGKDHTSIRNDILFINNLKEQNRVLPKRVKNVLSVVFVHIR